MQGPAPAMAGDQGRLQALMNRLTKVSPLRGYLVPVMITSNPQINAGTDGRLVYLNAGLLQAFGHNDQVIAAVLAHELGHMIGHHAPRGNSQDLFWNAAAPAASVHWISSLSVLALRETSKMTSKAHNRYEEKEADAVAAVLCARAGFDPYALEIFLGTEACGKYCAWKPSMIPVTNYANPLSAAQGVSLFILRASPLYKTHPPNLARQKTIHAMAETAQGKRSLEALKAEDPWLAALYQTLEARSPKKL